MTSQSLPAAPVAAADDDDDDATEAWHFAQQRCAYRKIVYKY